MKLTALDGRNVFVNKRFAVAVEPYTPPEDADAESFEGPAAIVFCAAVTFDDSLQELDGLTYVVRGEPNEIAEQLDLV